MWSLYRCFASVWTHCFKVNKNKIELTVTEIVISLLIVVFAQVVIAYLLLHYYSISVSPYYLFIPLSILLTFIVICIINWFTDINDKHTDSPGKKFLNRFVIVFLYGLYSILLLIRILMDALFYLISFTFVLNFSKDAHILNSQIFLVFLLKFTNYFNGSYIGFLQATTNKICAVEQNGTYIYIPRLAQRKHLFLITLSTTGLFFIFLLSEI